MRQTLTAPTGSPRESSDSSRLVGPGIHVPALDGLRGLAVVAVVVYHLWPDVAPGGWLGVGLFFTLSGFLVVGILDDENTANARVDLPRFYRRRVRRLLPASLVTLLVVVGWVALTETASRGAVASDGFWAVLNLANWNQMADPGGYAAIFEQSSAPLGHMWSLAIEEQFYLLAPLAIGWTRRPVRVVVAGAVIALVGHAIWWGTSDAYLATPVRIAEIVVGAAIALAVRRRPGVVEFARLWPLAAAVGIVAVLVVGESDDIVVRGFPAAIAVAWAVLVLACLRPATRYARFLSNDVLRWIGLRSYAIYLIHWPVIELTDWSPPVVIAVTLALSEISFRVLEDPIRRARRIRRPLVTLFGGVVILAVAFAAGAAAWNEPSQLADPAEAATLPAWLDEANSDDGSGGTGDSNAGGDADVLGTIELADDPPGAAGAAGRSTELTAGARRVPVVAVMGDSTATQLAAGLRARGDATRSLAVVDRTDSGCSALIDAAARWRTYRVSFGYLGEFAFDEPCRRQIATDDVRADVIVMIDHGSVMADHLRADGTWASVLDGDLLADLDVIYRNRAAEARAIGARLVLTTAPPIVDTTGLLGEMDNPARLTAYNTFVRELAASEPDVALIDLVPAFEDADAGTRYPRVDGLHVDLGGAERLAADVLVPALLDIAAQR